MRTFFTADTHFGHGNIIGHCDRPFASVEEMDEALIANWNAVVSRRDTVWHLGDFAYRANAARVEELFARLNGVKHLIIGNHDDNTTRRLAWASEPRDRAYVALDGQRLVLDHYGMRVWPGHRRGAVHLYGHSHGRLPGIGNSTDVGVDCWDFRPVTLDEIKPRLTEQVDFDPEETSSGPSGP